jgi:hypothetical protein
LSDGDGREGVRRCRSAARAISTATTTSSGGGTKDPLGVEELWYALVCAFRSSRTMAGGRGEAGTIFGSKWNPKPRLNSSSSVGGACEQR